MPNGDEYTRTTRAGKPSCAMPREIFVTGVTDDNLRPFRSIGDLARDAVAKAISKHKGAAE